MVRGDQFVVASFYSTADLGAYAAAALLTMARTLLFSRIFASVMLPVMAKAAASAANPTLRRWVHMPEIQVALSKAFGETAKVGIIAMEDPSYDGKHWWRSSEGVREVLGEGIGYLYARFFFSAR